MCKIDFSIIGAQKSGTTALFDMLKQHPDISFPLKKEDGYFVQDELYRQGDSYLSKLYRDGFSGNLVGYSYVNLMYFYEVTVPRLHQNNPQMRVVCVLRDPVERAYSAFQFMRSRGVESAQSFEDALLRERRKGDSGGFSYQADMTYLRHGMYADQLAPFIERFGRDSLLVITQDELRRDYKGVCRVVFEFLGLSDTSFDVKEKVSNKTGQPASTFVSRLVYMESPLKRLYQSLFNVRIRAVIRQLVIRRVKRINMKDVGYVPIDGKTEEELRVFYRPHNARLESLLGRKFNW